MDGKIFKLAMTFFILNPLEQHDNPKFLVMIP